MSLLSKWRELEEEARNLFLRKLGPLAHLAGIWRGTGYTFIFRPDGEHGNPFCFQQNITNEVLTFIPLLTSVTDRGAQGQIDVPLKGIFYEQVIVDATKITNVLHFESGHWLFIPKTAVPLKGDSVARQATILHGASFTATGDAPSVKPTDVKPNIISVGTAPIGPQVDTPHYLDQFDNATLLPGLPEGSIKDPSLILKHQLATQKVIDSVTFDVSAKIAAPESNGESGGIANIPFLDKNAQVTSLRAALYVEHIEDSDGQAAMQLQYIQSTMLKFDEINWPHVSVANLRRFQLY